MTQDVVQVTAQEAGRHPTRFRPGVSGNPAGSVSPRVTLQRKITEFAAPYGGVAALAADEIELLRQAAILSTRRVGDIEQQVRVANALRSIFQFLADRHRNKPSDPLAADAEIDTVAVALRQLRR